MIAIKKKAFFDYNIRVAMLVDNGNCPYVNIACTPNFTTYNNDIKDDCVVICLNTILDSLTNEGEQYILTCECGDPEDAGITGPITVSNTNTSIIWTLNTSDYEDIIRLENVTENIQLSLIFDKHQYTEKIIAMIYDVQQKILEGIPLRSLSKENFTRNYKSFEIAKEICDKYPNILYFGVDEVFPNNYTTENILNINIKDKIFS